MWYCFGCGAGGDRFEYISVRFNVDHIEAINITAEIEGVDLTPYYAELSPEDMIRENLFKENALARQLAHEALLKDETALTYLRGRGMTDESIELFQLGFAPPANGRISIFDTVANSPVLQLDRMDMFNNAILFPITDVFGRMRYFQSRPFNPLPGMKYIGGNDNHPLYDETDRIFGFHISRKMLYKNGGRIIGVEGAPDTIACIQAGLCACGFLGTVVNQLTFDLLGKYRVVELTLLLDGDKAGRDRSFKICEKYLTLQTNVRLRVASLPDGYDPDEFINKYGVDKLKEIVDSAPYAVQYLIDNKWNEAKTPTEKMQFMYDIQKYMNAITDKMVKHIMVMDIAGKMGLDPVQVEDYYVQSVASSSDGKLYALDG
jgi:DNA primase